MDPCGVSKAEGYKRVLFSLPLWRELELISKLFSSQHRPQAPHSRTSCHGDHDLCALVKRTTRLTIWRNLIAQEDSARPDNDWPALGGGACRGF